MNRFNTYLLTGTAILIIPFIYSHETSDPTIIPRIIALSSCLFILTTLLIIKCVRRSTTSSSVCISENNPLHRSIFPIILGYLLFSVVSIISSINVAESIIEFVKIFLMFQLIVVSTIIFTDDENAFQFLAKSITLIVLIMGIIGIIQYYSHLFDFLPGIYKPYATMQHKNLYVSYLFLTVPFVIYTLFSPPLHPITDLDNQDKSGTNQKKTSIDIKITNIACVIALLLMYYIVSIS